MWYLFPIFSYEFRGIVKGKIFLGKIEKLGCSTWWRQTQANMLISHMLPLNHIPLTCGYDKDHSGLDRASDGVDD